jgi:Ca2+/Na+ antiporter
MMILFFLLLVVIYYLPTAELRLFITNTMSIIWLIVLPIYAIYIYNKYDKEYKLDKDIYFTKVSTKRTPVELCYLMKNRICPRCVTATIMNLIKKQVLTVDKAKQNIILIYNEGYGENLVRSETFLIHWLMKRIGNGKQVSLHTIISEYGLNRNYFYTSYREWVNHAMVESVKQNFFEKRSDLIQNLYAFAAIGFILFIYSFIISSPNTVLIMAMFVCAFAFTLYVSGFYKRTKIANEEYATWKAFLHTLNNYDGFDDNSSIDYLEECAIYAYTLGAIKPYQRLLKYKFKDKLELLNSSNLLNMVLNNDIVRMGNVIEKYIKKSIIRESIFER